MEPNYLTQANGSIVPPADPTPGALWGSSTAASTSPALAIPPLPDLPRETTAQRSQLLPIRLPFVPRPVPVAVGLLLAETLQSRWECYCEQLRRCQRKFSEKAVHELRVATRRLLAQLALVSCVAPGAELDKARLLLKRRLTALGDLRDAHVQHVFIDDKTLIFPELLLLRRWLRRRERRLARSAARAVKRCKTRKLTRWTAVMIAGLTASADSSRVQNRLAVAVLRATARAFAEAVGRRKVIDLADLRTVHQTRVAFKRFRYMVEALSPSLTGLSKRELRALAWYQRRMGIIQDLEVMQGCLARYIRQNEKRERLLGPFRRYLLQRRGRALRSFLKSADRLYGFWPPARLAAPDHAVPTRSAA